MSGAGQNLGKLRASLKNYRVAIVGAAKGQPTQIVQEVVEAGLSDLGNNYVQEGARLRASLAPHFSGTHAPRWHFIGHIQSRKAKDLLDYDLVHSLDRTEIAAIFQRRLEPLGRTLDALVEINTGGEASKSGIAPESLQDFLKAMEAFPLVRIRGLMAFPPPLQPVELRIAHFRLARKLFESHGQNWDTLSMGTSDDYLVAADEGSTLVRLGTVLFGPRP